MAGGVPKPGECADGLAENVEDTDQGGGEAMGVRIFFKVVVQSVLLFGAETGVVTPCMERVLGGFQYYVARRLMGKIQRRRIDRKWEYTSAEVARPEAGFEPMET